MQLLGRSLSSIGAEKRSDRHEQAGAEAEQSVNAEVKVRRSRRSGRRATFDHRAISGRRIVRRRGNGEGGRRRRQGCGSRRNASAERAVVSGGGVARRSDLLGPVGKPEVGADFGEAIEEHHADAGDGDEPPHRPQVEHENG